MPNAKRCIECSKALPVSDFSPRGYSPDGEVSKRAPRCKPCMCVVQNWERERLRRIAWLERRGLGPSGGDHAPAEDQQLPKEPLKARPMPLMPTGYFAQRGKRGPYKKRMLTPEEEAAKMKRQERLERTKAYQKAQQARRRREGLLFSIEQNASYLAYVRDHVREHGDMHLYVQDPDTGELRRTPWKVYQGTLQELEAYTAPRLQELRAKLSVTPEVTLPALS